LLVNSKYWYDLALILAECLDHGISSGAAKIDECEQTAEGISKEMFDNESFETWYVFPADIISLVTDI
jgi:hypothetical protein